MQPQYVSPCSPETTRSANQLDGNQQERFPERHSARLGGRQHPVRYLPISFTNHANQVPGQDGSFSEHRMLRFPVILSLSSDPNYSRFHIDIQADCEFQSSHRWCRAWARLVV